MPKVFEVIQRLLPGGTARTGESVRWTACPDWPPDLFAIAASLVNLSGCYSDPSLISPWSATWLLSHDYPKEVADIGLDWSKKVKVPRRLQRLWRGVLKAGQK